MPDVAGDASLEQNVRFYSSHQRPAWKARLIYDVISKRNLARRALTSAKAVPRNADVLDVGFGDAMILQSLDRSNRIGGAELIPEYVRRAKERAGQLGFAGADFREYAGRGPLPFGDGVADLVICSHVLEHVPDDRFLLSEIRRMVRKEGRALLLIPINEEGIEDPNHVRKYETGSFLDLLRDHGLEPEATVEGDRTWYVVGPYFENGWHDRWGPIGFLGSAAINVPLALMPFPILAAAERFFPRHWRPRQLVVVARPASIRVGGQPT